MIVFEKTDCPICKQGLVHTPLSRLDKYQCPSGHYSYLDLFELKAKSIVIELKDFCLTFRQGSEFSIVTVYKERGGFKFIMNLPHLNFEWDKLDKLNDRIKTLVLLS